MFLDVFSLLPSLGFVLWIDVLKGIYFGVKTSFLTGLHILLLLKYLTTLRIQWIDSISKGCNQMTGYFCNSFK
jgi:hypothetical protein